MSATRYNFVNDYHYCGWGEVEDDNGEYVEYADYQKLLDENAKLRASIDRVRALHTPITRTTRLLGTPYKVCTICRDGDGYLEPYPCDTIRTLDGEDA